MGGFLDGDAVVLPSAPQLLSEKIVHKCAATGEAPSIKKLRPMISWTDNWSPCQRAFAIDIWGWSRYRGILENAMPDFWKIPVSVGGFLASLREVLRSGRAVGTEFELFRI